MMLSVIIIDLLKVIKEEAKTMMDVEELRKKRIELGISVREAAKYIGCGYEVFKRRENGRNVVRLDFLKAYNRYIEDCISGKIKYRVSPNMVRYYGKPVQPVNDTKQESNYPRTKEGWLILGDFI